MPSDLEEWMSILLDKHCFFCQDKTSTTRNPLKETVGGNWMHKNCADSLAWLEPYTDSKLVPDFKKKTKTKKDSN